MQLWPAIAEQALQQVACEALAMNADQHGFLLDGYGASYFDADAALAQRQVRLGVHNRRIHDHVKVAMPCWQFQRQLAFDELLALPAVLDKFLDRTHLELMLLA